MLQLNIKRERLLWFYVDHKQTRIQEKVLEVWGEKLYAKDITMCGMRNPTHENLKVVS